MNSDTLENFFQQKGIIPMLKYLYQNGWVVKTPAILNASVNKTTGLKAFDLLLKHDLIEAKVRKTQTKKKNRVLATRRMGYELTKKGNKITEHLFNIEEIIFQTKNKLRKD